MVVVQEAVVIQERHQSPKQRSTYYYNNWSGGFAPPQGPTFTGPPIPQNQLRHQHPREHLT